MTSDGHHTDPKVVWSWVEYKMLLKPEWSAWNIMVWLERNGYDVWCVVEVGHSRNRSHEFLRYLPGSSPEYVISRRMTEIRLKRSSS
jgi:hypothetical protein